MQAILYILLSLSVHADPNLLVLGPGEMKSVPLRSSEPIRVSSSQVVRVIDQGPRIVLVGRKVGRAIISHGAGAYRIEVVSPAVRETYSAFAHACARMQGLTVDVESDQVIVRGRMLRWRDWGTLKSLREPTGGAWFMRAALDQSIANNVRSEFSRITESHGLPAHSIELSPVPHIQTSEAGARMASLKMFAENYGLMIKADPSRLGSEGIIRLRLTFAEVQGDAGERLGLDFTDGQTVQVLPKLKGPRELSAALALLSNKGHAKVLATPSLTARSGTEAEFLAGGEFAVRSGNYRKSEVAWKRHGLWLKFKPLLDPRGIVRMDIHTELSMPDFAGAVDGIPSVRSSRTNASIDLRVGQTLLLSGLIRSWAGQSWTGVAGISEIPVLGRLFRSESSAESRTELMVFLTPELVSDNSDRKEREEWN